MFTLDLVAMYSLAFFRAASYIDSPSRPETPACFPASMWASASSQVLNVMVLIMVLIPFNKITQSGSWQPKLWINKMPSIWILTGKGIDCLHSLYTGELLRGHKKKASVHAKKGDFGPKKPGGVTWVNFCWVCAGGISEHLPHYSLFCGQFPRQLQTPSLSLLGKYVIFAIPTFTFTFYFLELTHFLDWIRPLYFPSAVQTFWYVC